MQITFSFEIGNAGTQFMIRNLIYQEETYFPVIILNLYAKLNLFAKRRDVEKMVLKNVFFMRNKSGIW